MAEEEWNLDDLDDDQGNDDEDMEDEEEEKDEEDDPLVITQNEFYLTADFDQNLSLL